jgi:CheY-like chemotaxis protein
MEKITSFNEHLGVQHGLEEYPLEDPLDVLESGRVGGSKGRILRLVMTPTAGGELLRRLRNDPLTSDIPVMILTR